MDVENEMEYDLGFIVGDEVTYTDEDGEDITGN